MIQSVVEKATKYGSRSARSSDGQRCIAWAQLVMTMRWAMA
jgi:hypothetical protein